MEWKITEYETRIDIHDNIGHKICELDDMENARLIASAPDMLEMLKRIHTMIGEDLIDYNSFDMPDEHIDKYASINQDIFELLNKIERRVEG